MPLKCLDVVSRPLNCIVSLFIREAHPERNVKASIDNVSLPHAIKGNLLYLFSNA
jgi:hypothetical protein